MADVAASDCIPCDESLPRLSVTPDKSLSPSESPTSPRACARVMPKNFRAKTGVEVIPGVYLGRELGAGVQAKVFDLMYEDGSSVGKVLKIGHRDFGHGFLNSFASSMMNLQYEWELGMQLKAALETPDGELPGFTRTCDCMVVLADENNSTATFQGLIMEKLNGWPVYKRILDPSFHNIHYIRELLFQVFSALDRAQRQLGFNHADLGMRNVFEHYPKVFEEVSAKNKEQNTEALKQAGGTCAVKPSLAKTSLTPGRSDTWTRTKPSESGCSPPPARVGFSCDSDGDLMPLGPNVEFKIIDYGVGEFNEVLAQAAGGYQPEETLRRIHEVFAERGIPLGVDSQHKIIDMVTDMEPIIKKRHKFSHKLQKWTLKQFGKASDNRYVAQAVDPNHTNIHRTKSAIRATLPQRGTIEKMYRRFWQRKGDVFHLLLTMAVALDDRVWPKEDEKDVQLFVSLVHHVTGVRLRAYFASAENPRRFKVMGKRAHSEHPHNDGHDEGMYGARVRCFNALRRLRITLAAHFKPFNSGLLAGEALTAPFFGQKGAPHAELPVCVEAAFPFRETGPETPQSTYRQLKNDTKN